MKKNKIIRIVVAIIGIFFVGTGVAFNAASALGNDPIGILYDGIRNVANLSPNQLGTASNVVNILLGVLILFLNPHYINIGTLIYILPYGTLVDIGGKVYAALFKVQTLPIRIFSAGMGCLLLYFGIAIFIVADVGLDPFTGIVMVLKDKCKKEYRVIKICFDVGCIVIGYILGGKLGVTTFFAAVTAGPVIQMFTENIRKRLK